MAPIIRFIIPVALMTASTCTNIEGYEVFYSCNYRLLPVIAIMHFSCNYILTVNYGIKLSQFTKLISEPRASDPEESNEHFDRAIRGWLL